MRLDVVIPTHNRAALLARTLQSLLDANLPPNVELLNVVVVNNNCTDHTSEVIESFLPRYQAPRRLTPAFESKPGKSAALNTGIRSSDGDVIGLIDDDEEVDRSWVEEIGRWLARDDMDFIGGPCRPRWEHAPPDWLPEEYSGVIGRIDAGPEARPFGPEFPGILTGGNAVVRRRTLESAGPYSEVLNRTSRRLLSGEDEEMYHRLLKLGARGMYVPELVIYHFVPGSRMTRRYYRRWCFWRAVGLGVQDRTRRQNSVYLCGVPRWMFGVAFRSLGAVVRRRLRGRGDAARDFTAELHWWDLAGFLFGRHLYRA